MKFYKVVSNTILQFRQFRWITVSFQKFGDRFCCFQGDGMTEGIIGWGKTKLEAAGNLIYRKNYWVGGSNPEKIQDVELVAL